MRQWFGSALVQIMACRLFGAKPLSKPMLGYCQLDPYKQTSLKFESNYKTFHSRKFVWKYRLRNGSYFVHGGGGGGGGGGGWVNTRFPMKWDGWFDRSASKYVNWNLRYHIRIHYRKNHGVIFTYWRTPFAIETIHSFLYLTENKSFRWGRERSYFVLKRVFLLDLKINIGWKRVYSPISFCHFVLFCSVSSAIHPCLGYVHHLVWL